jgi:protein-S-isoprenylcysteine O-methyltransferase Ste14
VIEIDPRLLVRAAAVYIPAALILVASAWRRPDARVTAGALLAGVWNVVAVLALHVASQRWQWWTYDAEGGLLLGLPVDLYLAWVCLWGVLPAIAFRTLPIGFIVLLALTADLLLMPAAAPVVTLGPHWLVGEGIGLAIGLVPAQLLARWTARHEQLVGRALLQVAAFTGLLVFVLPAVILDNTGVRVDLDMPPWQWGLIAQVIAIPAILGLTAVQEFVSRGGGTPVPFDPPRRLVTSGVYAFVRNPMQLSAAVVLLLLGVFARSWWLAAAAVMAHIYSIGLAGWDEDEDLRARFGDGWVTYRQGVRRWVPRWRPWHAPAAPPARLYVSGECGMCTQVGGWFAARGARGLTIVAAESHPSRMLTRITYDAGDGSVPAAGVAAIARALEHLHFGWAFAGFVLRLPVVVSVVQLLVDASGGEPRRIGGAVDSPMAR